MSVSLRKFLQSKTEIYLNCKFILNKVKKSDKLENKIFLLVYLALVLVFFNFNLISANVYYNDIYFTSSDAVYTTNERVELKGYVYQANYTNNGTQVTSSSALA